MGDAEFQDKYFDVFERCRREARPVVLVTHDLAAIEQYWDRRLPLADGTVTKNFTSDQPMTIRALPRDHGRR